MAHSIRGALEYASAELKSDREIVMEAVAQEDQKSASDSWVEARGY